MISGVWFKLSWVAATKSTDCLLPKIGIIINVTKHLCMSAYSISIMGHYNHKVRTIHACGMTRI